MAERFVRKPSATEMLLMDLQEYLCPMTFRYVLELSEMPDLKVLSRTLATIMETHSGYNLRYKRGKYFVSENPPKITFKHTTVKRLSQSSPVLNFRDHTLEVGVRRTDDDRFFLVFDFFHGATDGHGALKFIHDFFDVLNGNKPQEPDFSVRDVDILKKVKCTSNKIPVKMRSVPENKNIIKKTDEKAYYKRICHDGKVFAPTASMCIAIASIFKRSVIMVPTDIRRFAETDNFLSGNLSLPLFLQLSGDEEPSELFKEIRGRIDSHEALNTETERSLFFAKLPTFIRKPLVKLVLKYLEARRDFTLAAMVSNVGELYSESLENPYFEVVDFYLQPNCEPVSAFWVLMSSYKGRFSVSLGGHPNKVSRAAAKELVQKIKNILAEGEE